MSRMNGKRALGGDAHVSGQKIGNTLALLFEQLEQFRLDSVSDIKRREALRNQLGLLREKLDETLEEG